MSVAYGATHARSSEAAQLGTSSGGEALGNAREAAAYSVDHTDPGFPRHPHSPSMPHNSPTRSDPAPGTRPIASNAVIAASLHRCIEESFTKVGSALTPVVVGSFDEIDLGLPTLRSSRGPVGPRTGVHQCASEIYMEKALAFLDNSWQPFRLTVVRAAVVYR